MDTIPSIIVFIPGVLRDYCEGRAELSIEAPTVREALARLERDHAELHRNICDETGRVRRHINVFVNLENTRFLAGVDTPLASGDVVTILPAVSGG